MKMSLFNYPTTVIWVDDSQVFINSIQKNSDAFNQCQIKTFLCPIECLDYFKEYKPMNLQESFLLSCKNYEESDLINHIPIDIDFEKICSVLHDNQITNDISVMIVDQNMPGMNGIELCKQLNHLPFKKILLTSFIAEDEVISAFNNRIIDGYIRKNSDNFIEEINTQIKLLSENYLAERSSSLLAHLEADKKSHFSDPNFREFFSNWCSQNNIVKYFLIDKIGNMRVINDKCESSNFIVYNDDTIDEFISLNIIDEPNEFVEIIASKKRLPFFGERKHGWEFEASKWDKYLYPCNLLNGKTQYYWFTV
jgi:CheY-like chemotaxis protein